MIIRPEPLTPKVFSPFGEVLATDNITAETINHGNTLKFPDLANITVSGGGRVQLSIYRSTVTELPFRLRVMERHPLGSQIFFPLHERPFPVIVATHPSNPDSVRIFMTNGRQGVNLHAGVWHHYQLSLEQVSEYLVIDRHGPGENCQEYRLRQTLIFQQ